MERFGAEYFRDYDFYARYSSSRILVKRFKRLASFTRILDVGCAMGYLVKAFADEV